VTEKRVQLDRVATALVSKQKELEFELQRANLTLEGQTVFSSNDLVLIFWA
jgi:hypothetical protein